MHELANAALGLSRSALLDGINPHYKSSLSTVPLPGEQTSMDLCAMNSVRMLADGSVPLRTWLQNAAALADGVMRLRCSRHISQPCRHRHDRSAASRSFVKYAWRSSSDLTV